MTQLSGLRIACLATDGVEQSELTSPVDALRQSGAIVEVIAPHGGTIQGFRHLDEGDPLPVDRTLGEIGEGEYDGLCLPGGALNADALRTNPGVQDLVRKMDDAGKPIAAICHAPWILVSARLVKGRRLTSYHTIRDDIDNAGGEWIDQPVVEDRNWVTSRQPDDLEAFNRAAIALFARTRTGAKAA